jgi:hypothetical protein
LLNNVSALGANANQPAIFYYRADGGSVTGVGPLVATSHGNPSATNPGFTSGRGSQLNRLDQTSGGCTAPVAGVSTCTIGATYNGNTDAPATGLKYDWINLGISDLEPTAFVGENWGTAFPFVGPAATKATLAAIPSTPVFNQVFSLIASNSGSTSGITNLSRQSVANIFNGTYSDWSQVPTDNLGAKGLNGDAGSATAPGGYTAGTITVCRRDPGSGTQAGASIVFESQGCNPSAKAFVQAPAGPLGNPVIVSLATGSEGTCVGTNTGGNAIGYVVTQTAPGKIPAGTHYVSIDGIPGDQTRAALGVYPWMFELTFNHLTGSLTNANQTAMYNYLLSQLGSNATDPASPNIVSVPGVGGNIGTLNASPNGLTYSAVNNIPIAIGTRSGNSCSIEVGVN